MDTTAVFVEDSCDRFLISRLMPDKQGLLFFSFELIDAIEFNCNTIIVCHRASAQTPQPQLPFKHNTSRLVVLSDCQHEKVVVDTLLAGAHHYIDLNDSETVLSARLNAALRYHLKKECQTLSCDPYIFNQDSRTVGFKNRLLDLSPREFELAYYLFSNRNRIVTDAELLTSVWTLPPSVDSRRIDTSICRIRKKMYLNSDLSKWNIVRTRREGYQVLC